MAAGKFCVESAAGVQADEVAAVVLLLPGASPRSPGLDAALERVGCGAGAIWVSPADDFVPAGRGSANHKLIYRLYRQEHLSGRTKTRKKRAAQPRVPLGRASKANERWAMDLMADRLADGRAFGVLTIVDQFSRECPLLEVGASLTGRRVVDCLERLALFRGRPQAITVDNGSEFCSRGLDAWAYQHGVKLDFIQPGKPVENGFIESFHGKLRDESLNTEIFFALEDARQKLARWRRDYNEQRPHSALGGLPPTEHLRRIVEKTNRQNRIAKIRFPLLPPVQ